MLNPECKITLQWAANSTYPNRSGEVTFRFVEELEIQSSWRTLGDTAKLRMPRGSGNGVSTLYAVDKEGNIRDYTRGIANVPVGADGQAIPNAWPLVMRGDHIQIELGYRFFTNEATVTGGNQSAQPKVQKLVSNIIFQGWVTRITNRIPIEIECMDDNWKFQQFAMPTGHVYKPTDTIEDIIQDILYQYNSQLSGIDRTVYYKPTQEEVRTTTNASFVVTQNETFAQILERLRKTCAVECFLKPDTEVILPQKLGTPGIPRPGTLMALHASPVPYWPDTGNTNKNTFKFQENIISDSLQYLRIDDINAGCVAYGYIKGQVTKRNKSNNKLSTKSARYEVFVAYQNGKLIWRKLAAGTTPQAVAGGFQGEFKTYYFWLDQHMKNGRPDEQAIINDLKNQAASQLKRFAYEGWRGSFVTFGLPNVSHGEQIIIQDLVLPERDGTYFIRSVNTSYGINGFRQKVDLDLRADGPTGTAEPWKPDENVHQAI